MFITLLKEGYEPKKIEVNELYLDSEVIEFSPKIGWRSFTPDAIATPLQLVVINTAAPFVNSNRRPAFVIDSVKPLIQAVCDGDIEQEYIP